ncbi:MAG: hypothetical protein JWQ09_1433 [Segetibacter sp.]|nr:hypothetical protein [Segetibacter sp.]
MNFINFRLFSYIAVLTITAFACKKTLVLKQAAIKGNGYYVSATGNDANIGSKANPWKSIAKLNSLQLKPGDTVFFQGNQAFKGPVLFDSIDVGTKQSPIVITSFGNGNAVIDGGNLTALTVNNTEFIKINHLSFIGTGRKNGNIQDGVVIRNSRYIEADDLDISGFQKAGLLVNASQNIEIKNVLAHENGFAGISISGEETKESCNNIHINRCSAVNNPGDPANLDNHSGNGIIAGYCRNVLIEYSSATNNGWDMPRTGNGPVGIWCYEADSVTIQYCISYKNKTSFGGGDGGGFDLDGGVTNSVIQQCLSYDNQGSGFGIFQYDGASKWHDNIIRNNISENDGSISAAKANIFIWNGTRDENQFKNLQFYNNILYNSKGAAINYDKESEHTSFWFYNNIFVAKDELVMGKDAIGNDVFLNNDWWSLISGFKINGIKDFETWIRQSGKEQDNGKIVGYNEDPHFTNPGNASLISPFGLQSFSNYEVPGNSRLKQNLPVYK